MSREEFLEVLARQYAEQIQEAYLECEHSQGQIDITELKEKIITLQKNSRAQGLSSKQFVDILQSTLPEDIRLVLGFDDSAESAA